METLPLKGQGWALRAVGLRRTPPDIDSHGGLRWDAFEQLVRREHSDLRRFAQRLVADAEQADDALQNAYLSAFRALPRFRRLHPTADAAWLYRIVYRSCIDELRRTRRRQQIGTDAIAEIASPLTGPEAQVIARASLLDALQQLTPEARATVLLVDGQGFGYEAAAEILGVPRGTIASRLNTSRPALRRALEDWRSEARHPTNRIGGEFNDKRT
jgi:RNA polymerase sigma-70 factor, ECF subfamily